MIQNNPMINQFNGYMMQNPQMVPFQGNQLINQNVHVRNNLDDFVHHHKMVQQNLGNYQQMMNQGINPMVNQGMNPMTSQGMNPMINQGINPMINQGLPDDNRSSKSNGKKVNIIEEMMKPQKIDRSQNKDVTSNFKVRDAKQKSHQGEEG